MRNEKQVAPFAQDEANTQSLKDPIPDTEYIKSLHEQERKAREEIERIYISYVKNALIDAFEKFKGMSFRLGYDSIHHLTVEVSPKEMLHSQEYGEYEGRIIFDLIQNFPSSDVLFVERGNTWNKIEELLFEIGDSSVGEVNRRLTET